ncbi:MAG TPA: creatininase family protein [Gammaproteobacteria bacterium]
MHSGCWQDLTTTDFAAVDPESTVALLPVAAVEQHGPHLPLSTDAVIAAELARAVLGRMSGATTLLVLPLAEIGHSPEHASFAGTLTARAETLLALWTEIGRSVANAGVRKLIMLNSHGGQKALVDIVATRLRADHGLFVVRANTFSLGTPPGLFDPRELALGLHGGDFETSLMLHLRPDLVRTERIADFVGLPERLAAEHQVLGVEKPIGFGWLSEDLHPDGAVGRAGRASAEKGARCFEHLVSRLARLVDEVAATPLTVLRGRP